MSRQSEYEFLLVVDGVSVDDEQVVSCITNTFDGLLSWNRGVHRLAVCSEGQSAIDALEKLRPRLASEVPSLRLLRLDLDLVGVSDIADRTGHSRQNVQQWVTSERHARRPFPPPEGSAGRSPVWRWAEVNAWLKPLGIDDHMMRPTREESAFIDVALMAWDVAYERGRLPLDADLAACWHVFVDSVLQNLCALESPVVRPAEGHKNLIARIPSVTGRELPEWFANLESGPAFLRCEERAHWLADEHGLTHGYANAIVHEYEVYRRIRINSGASNWTGAELTAQDPKR
jgi:predicted DNA-binding transcriptional regulator AlpA